VKEILKEARNSKKFSTRKLSELTNIDQALISKFESGNRLPTKIQIQKLVTVLNLNLKDTLIAWYKVKLLNEFELNPFVIQAFIELLREKGFDVVKTENKNEINSILDEIEILKSKLENLK
jgi:transcriptional regulator with XRE-family HTH domain